MSLKILHVINGLGRGGAEEMLHKLIRYNENNKKVQHFILSLSKNDPTLENRFKEYNIEVLNFNFFNFIKILFYLKKKNISIIQGWMYHGNSFAFFLKFFFLKSKLFFNIRHSLPNYFLYFQIYS